MKVKTDSFEIYSYEQLINEISELTALDKGLVERKVWLESLNAGHNVVYALNFELNFHTYDIKMEMFYKETHAFIIETMVESCRKGKRAVMEIIKNRIKNYISISSKEVINILMLGDGSGGDTIYLHNEFNNSANIFYFDVPGSKTFEFAMTRFKKRNVKVEIITDLNKIPQDFFDVVICLEVLEHLPQPEEAIQNISKFLNINGISLVTESFGAVDSNYPTHLKSNLKYVGRTPILFLQYNLLLTFFNDEPSLRFRPMEFTKKVKINLADSFNIYLQKSIIKLLIKNLIKQTIVWKAVK